MLGLFRIWGLLAVETDPHRRHVVSTRLTDRRIGPVGTIARVCVGLVLLAAAVSTGIELSDVLVGLVVLPVSVIAVLWLRGLKAPPLRLFGPVGYTVNFGLAGLLLLVVTVPALIFYGASMLLAAWRGYAGCEILAIQNWATGRDDRMACPVFSPIDGMERRMQMAGK